MARLKFVAAVGAVQIQAEAAAQQHIAFGFDALRGRCAVGEEGGVAVEIGKARIGIVELDVIRVDIEGDFVRFPDRADLPCLALDGGRQRRHVGVLDVEHAARRDFVAGGELHVGRQILLQHVVRIDRRQHGFISGRMVDAGRAAQVTHGFSVVSELRQRLPVNRIFDARRQLQSVGDIELIFGERLQGGGLEGFMEVRQHRIDPGERAGRELIAIGIGRLGPQTGAEHAERGLLAQTQQIAISPVAVEFVGGAGGGDSRAVVVLLIVIRVGVQLVVELPSVAEIGGQSDIIEIRCHMVKVITEIGRIVRIAAQQVVIAELRDLRARGALVIWRIGLEIDI